MTSRLGSRQDQNPGTSKRISDNRGRQARIKDANGTWTHTVYDSLGRVESIWVGTDNTGWTHTDPSGGGASGNNMVEVSENEYDNAGVGDGNSSKPAIDALAAAAKRGIVVVRSSRVPTGYTNRNAEVNDDQLGFAVSLDMNPQKARILTS